MANKKKPETEAPVKQEGGAQKLAAIRLAMDQIEKQYGKGSIMRLGGEGEKYKIDGVYSFDSDIYKLGLKIKAVK